MDYSDFFSPKLNRSVQMSFVLDLLKCPYDMYGDKSDKVLSGARTISKATADDIAFIDQNRIDIAETIEEVKSGILFCTEIIYEIIKNKMASHVLVITVSEPKIIYTQVVALLTHKMNKPGIHNTVIIGDGSQVHPSAVIGPFCVIGDDVTIREDVVISSHCFIGKNVFIGKRVNISSGVRIGNDGFGYIRDDNGIPVNFPHIGGVIIEDDVDIGANTCIDRGGLGNTHLKNGCKIDNLVHIAHNVIIGENAYVIANVMIGGSTVIGRNAYIAPSVTLRDVIKVEDNSLIGIGAVVTKNVPSGEVWVGSPARKLRNVK